MNNRAMLPRPLPPYSDKKKKVFYEKKVNLWGKGVSPFPPPL